MKKIVIVALVATTGVLSPTVTPVHAASQTILGRRLQVSNPSTPNRRRVSIVGQERTNVNTVVGNPTTAGATLQVTANGGTSTSQTFVLPSSGWRVLGTIGYRYTNSVPGGAVRQATIKRTPSGNFQVRTIISGRGGTVNIVPPNPGNNGGMVLTLNGGDSYCVSFGGVAGGVEQKDTAQRWQMRKATAEACPAPPTTTTSSSSSTTTTTLAACPAPPPAALGSLTTVIGIGSTDCGGPNLFPLPQAPFSGQILNPDNSLRANLGLGCLYVGNGQGQLPGTRLPDGGTTILDVSGVNGVAITATASDGTGAATCSKGAGPGKTCLNGLGACTSDADCANTTGACDLTANCYFGPPVPVPLGPASNCIMNAIQSDVCVEADLATMETSITSAGLNAQVYLTGDGASPCPRCVAGTCTAGQRAGLACSGGVGSELTTIECPPTLTGFAGKLNVNLSGLTTATSTLTPDGNGKFCPGQPVEGGFGGPAGTITETGTPLGGGMSLFETVLAGTFCVPSSGNGLFDSTAGLPGPGALGVKTTVSVCLLTDVCDSLCNPCNLGPLCDVICNPCVLCS